MEAEASERATDVPLPRAPASDDPGDKIVGIIKRVEETLFVPIFSLLLASPIWGPLAGWAFDWPLWLILLVSLTPCLSLFLAGAMHIALRKWTHLRRSRASSFEPPLILACLLAGVVAPLLAYYG
ncbi:MAG: hypothetical protein WEB00_08575 [Dehalococcoidia bacterium]